jgi:hypothetical protein
VSDDLDGVGRAIRELVPEPPRAINATELRDHVADRPARPRTGLSRVWLTVGASAAVVVAVAVVAVLVSTPPGGHQSHQPGTSPHSTLRSTPAQSVVPTPTVATPTAEAGGGADVSHPGHWRSTVLVREGIDRVTSVVTLNDDPYLLLGSRLERVSSTSGHVVEQTQVAGIPRAILANAGAIWLVTRDSGRLLLSEYSATLHLEATTALDSSDPHGRAALMAASPDGRKFFVTDSKDLFRVSLDPLRSTRIDTAITTPMIGLAVSAGTPAIAYIATGNEFHDVIDAYSVDGGRLEPLFGAAVGTVVEGISGGMAASSGGVWFASSTGNASGVDLITDDGRSEAGGAGGLYHAEVQVVGNTAWISAYDVLICANGSTGGAIAATLTPFDAQVRAVSADGAHAYALGHPVNSTHLALVRIDPPTTCMAK